jgi:hypothetical protein
MERTRLVLLKAIEAKERELKVEVEHYNATLRCLNELKNVILDNTKLVDIDQAICEYNLILVNRG